MAYIQPSRWTATPARHEMIMIPVTPELDWDINPVMLFKGVSALTALDACSLMSSVALTNGTTALTFTVELHTQSIQNPVTADTKLLNNIMAAPLTAGTAGEYQALDFVKHAFMPVRCFAPKSNISPSVQADADLGEERYDVVLKASAKAAQTGVVYVRILHYQYIEGDFTFGTDASCCTVGFTPATN